MRLGFIGDTHGKIDLMLSRSISLQIDIIIQVGDFGTFVDEDRMDRATRRHEGLGDFIAYYHGHKRFSVPTYFIKGNHEDFEVIEEIKQGKVSNLNYLDNGNVYEIAGLRIGALGGNYSPSRSRYPKSHPKLQGGKRKHFSFEDLESLKEQPLDIIVAHDCPDGIGIMGRNKQECGSEEMADLILQTAPEFFFHGHYHQHKESRIGSTQVISLGKLGGRTKDIHTLDV